MFVRKPPAAGVMFLGNDTFRARLTGDPQEAAWAGRRVYESIDRHVVTMTGHSLDNPEDELAVLSHPLVQAELARQQRDLKDLIGLVGATPNPSALLRLRERSQRDAASFLGA
jgi:hypothetical protein